MSKNKKRARSIQDRERDLFGRFRKNEDVDWMPVIDNTQDYKLIKSYGEKNDAR